jgi:hypothetical protein
VYVCLWVGVGWCVGGYVGMWVCGCVWVGVGGCGGHRAWIDTSSKVQLVKYSSK